MKIIVFGSESTGMAVCKKIIESNGGGANDILFTDNNPERWGKSVKVTTCKGGFNFLIKSPEELFGADFDKVFVASLTGCDQIVKQLIEQYGICSSKIDATYTRLSNMARLTFLECFAQYCETLALDGNVAELGVFQGEFAKEINKCFSKCICYLFDTFEGFDQRDLATEDRDIQELGGHLKNTSVELVMSKMTFYNMVDIRQGWFPQSANGLENEKFKFVNIDTDLYDSILSGLEFFYPKMVVGGVILVHDYFSMGYVGVKKAVDEFCKKQGIFAMPIGDDMSIAIQKKG